MDGTAGIVLWNGKVFRASNVDRCDCTPGGRARVDDDIGFAAGAGLKYVYREDFD